MATPTFDPALPAPNSLIRSEELRNQFNALKNQCDEQAGQLANLGERVLLLGTMKTEISNPPTQAEVTELRDKLNALLRALSI